MDNTDYGYDEVDAVAKETSRQGKYLTLPTDGKTFRIRIVSEPRYVYRHYLQGAGKNGKGAYELCLGKANCDLCKRGVNKSAQWGWIVIDRAANYPADPEAKDTVRIWKETSGINGPAFLIRDIVKLIDRNEKPVWGNPTTYDIKVSKKAKDIGYDWKIEPDPKNAQPLTEAEKQMVQEANYDLQTDMQNSNKSEHVGNYGARPNMETAPDSEVNPDDIPDDLGKPEKQATASQGTSEDDLPF